MKKFQSNILAVREIQFKKNKAAAASLKLYLHLKRGLKRRGP